MARTHLADVLVVTQAAFAAERAKLQTLKKRESDLRAQLAQLIQARDDRAQGGDEIADAALTAGADVRWHHWIAGRRTTINNELLQVIAQQGRQLTAVRRSFGKTEAVKELVKRDAASRAVIAARRTRDVPG